MSDRPKATPPTNATNATNESDLELEPMRGTGARKTAAAFALAVVAAAGAYTVNLRFASQRRASGLERTAAAVAALERCLIGVRPETGNTERASSVARRTWLSRARGRFRRGK